MKYKTKKIDSKPLNLPPLDKERSDEDDFTVDLVEASNELRGSLIIASKLASNIQMDAINQAVFFGLMVRLYKLYDTYILLIVEKRMEMALILGRSACDTAIDLAFLCDRFDNEEFMKFIKSSLATDRKIYDEIEKDKKDGKGNPIIQERIQSSILERFNDIGYTINDIEAKDWRLFGHVVSRAEECGLEREYNFIYRNLSRVTHGNWSEFVLYHLGKKDDLYYPNIKYSHPRPQSLDGISILIAEAFRKYVNTIAPKSEISNRLRQISEWFKAMAFKHEEFMINSTT